MNVYKGRLLKKIFRLKIKGSPFNAAQYMAFKHHISFATDLAANFGCNRFRITPDIVSKLLRAAIWSRCAVRFESEQTPFPRTGRRYRPAALHRIRFGTWGFVPMSYFNSETNEWSKDWAKRWARLWLAATSRQFHRNFKFHFTWKTNWLVAARYDVAISTKYTYTLQSTKTVTYLTVELSQYNKSGSTFSSSEQVVTRSDCSRLGTPCVCAGQSDPPKLCLSLPQELGHWFYSEILLLSSRIALGSDCQMTCTGRKGLEIGLKLELCRLTKGLQRFYLLLNPPKKVNKLCGVWILFRTPKLRTVVTSYQPSFTRLVYTILHVWLLWKCNNCRNVGLLLYVC